MSEISKIKVPIENELKEFQAFFKSLMKNENRLLNIVLKYILRQKGKQIRPVIVLLSAKAFGTINKSTYIGASMIELMHTATLIHDDVVDNANMRRGLFSINALWKNKIAVLIGDYLLSRGLLLAIDNNQYDFLKEISATVKQMSEGEILQIEKARKLNITEEVYYDIIKKKTAVLISTSTVLGAKSVSSDKEIIDKVRLLGEYLGMAFQIKDDLFDLQKTNKTGKDTGNDLQEKKSILRIIHKNKKSKQDVDIIRDFIIKKKGIEYSEKVMDNFKEKSLEIINTFPENEIKKSFIILVDYITSRKK